MQTKTTILLLILLAATASAATISGYVLDNETDRGIDEMTIEALPAGSGGPPTAVAYTDIDGRYSISVPAGTYDVYVRLGKENPKKTIQVDAGETEAADFRISLKNTYAQQPKEDYGTIPIVAAFAILAAAAYYLTKKKKTKEAEEQENKLLKHPKTPKDEVTVLKEEKDRLKQVMTAARKSYEKREINEERLKELMADYEKTLADVQKKIGELEAA